MTAFERGTEMMMIPIGKLPEKAQQYAQKLCSRVGICTDTYLTAWCHYAECVEGLPKSENEMYQADDEARLFFATGGIQ